MSEGEELNELQERAEHGRAHGMAPVSFTMAVLAVLLGYRLMGLVRSAKPVTKLNTTS